LLIPPVRRDLKCINGCKDPRLLNQGSILTVGHGNVKRTRLMVAGRFRFCACYTSSYREVIMKSKRKFTVVIERDEAGYYVASVPALRGCHTQAKTLDPLMKRVQEVVELCIEDGDELDNSLELVGIQQVSF
jgi:predicted RNase H-like HicB family nuclease